jgi:hypothetical protein
MAKDFFYEPRHIRLAVTGITGLRVVANLLKRAPRLLGIIATKSFAEEFAHAPAVALGQSFGLASQFRREADGVNP